MIKEKRFDVVLNESSFSGTGIKIIRDKETGVQYILALAGFGGGITILVDKDGKPLHTRLKNERSTP